MPAPTGATLLEIVNTVAQSVGHSKTTSVFSSQDEAILRLGFYANLACKELYYMNYWQVLSQTASISVVAAVAGETQSSFALPTDFKCMVDNTHWNRSTQLPAIGPINPQDWQWLIVRSAQITTRFMWRIRDGLIWVKSAPPPGFPQILTFEYMSKYWAYDQPSGGGADVPAVEMTKDTSWHVFPVDLVTLYTRAKWFENEGYDASTAIADFTKAFNWETGNDKGAATLSLVPSSSAFPYVGPGNAPDTGFGSSF